jgi:hypothetical protein
VIRVGDFEDIVDIAFGGFGFEILPFRLQSLIEEG